MELTYEEQRVFEAIEISLSFFEDELSKWICDNDIDIDSDAFLIKGNAIFAPLHQSLVQLEIAKAKEKQLFVTNESNNDDDVCENLERLFCSKQENDFILAKQILRGLVFSEKCLRKLLQNVYNYYLNWQNRNAIYMYGHYIQSSVDSVRGLNKLLEMEDFTEEKKREMYEMEIQIKKRLIVVPYMSILGEGEMCSHRLV